MIEKQSINGKDVWLKVAAIDMHRENPNIIPTEYFTVTYYWQDPVEENAAGETIKDEEGEVRLFESPVAALGYAQKKLSGMT